MKLYYNSNANKPVVYLIYNLHSHGVYIGQGSECKRRWNRGYALTLSKGKCHNKHLQNDYNKCKELLGHDDFIEFHVLKVMKNSTQIEREAEEANLIRFYKELGFKVYNNVDKTNSPQISFETIEKISKTKKEFYKTETGKKLIKNLANNKKGKTYEELYGKEKAKEIKAKISQNKLIEMNKPEVKKRLKTQLLGKTEIERYGKEKADLIKLKKSKARKGKYLGKESSRFKVYDNIKLQSPDGTIYTKIEGIKEFATQHKLSPNHLSELLFNKRKSHKGWKLLNQTEIYN